MYPPIHRKPELSSSFERLDQLWQRHEQYHEIRPFTTLEALLEEHPRYAEDYEEVREEYESCHYDRFLIALSLHDLPYRYATKELIEETAVPERNPYVESFMKQFAEIDTDRNACFLFPESFVSQFFVVTEVCRRAKEFHPVQSLFPDEEKVHYLAVFDKQNMDDILLMFHLLYSGGSQELYGGYSLYDYSLPWYQNHLWKNEVPFRSPFLPDRTAVFQGALPYYHNPAKTVYVRRNIQHILDCGYFTSELEFFLALIRDIMPVFQWWYADIEQYEEKDGYHTDWRMARTAIRTELTEQGVIKPKWKNELSLFHAVKKLYPDTLYQHRPDWLGLQSLDMYIPSLCTAIEYQGIQHYRPVEFFGGEEALLQRWELDQKKRKKCEENNVRFIEWPYDQEPTVRNIRAALEKQKTIQDQMMEDFLNLRDFDDYLEQFERFCGLRTGGVIFAKEQRLLESDARYTRREKEKLLEQRKRRAVEGRKNEIQTLLEEIQGGGIWILPVREKKRIEFRYRYPNGKQGDIDHYLAGLCHDPRQIKEQEYRVLFRAKDYELIELIGMSGGCLFTRAIDDNDPLTAFLLRHHRIAQIEHRMAQVNYYRQEYRSLRSVSDLELKKLLQDYHRGISAKISEIYGDLISEGKTNARWKSEQKAYAIVAAHFPDAQFQYQPDFLFGQRIDIYIPSVKTAIEYQGLQHYEPVSFFGGAEGFRRNQERDRRKYKRCEANGIRVIYWDARQPLTEEYFETELLPLIIR